MVRPERFPSREHEDSIILQNGATPAITAPTSLFGRFFTFINLKDTIDSSEDVFVHDDTSSASQSGASCDDYETEIEDDQGSHQACTSEITQAATLSDVKALKDQLEKLLTDEAPLENGSPAESPSLRLYLGNLIDNGYGIMVSVAADLTPLLSSKQGFLYYAIDDPETRGTPLKSPAAVMASSIAVHLDDLEHSKSVPFTALEQQTLSNMRGELATLLNKADSDNPFDQAAGIQQLRSIWTMTDSLTAAARSAEKFQESEHKNLPSQPEAVASASMVKAGPTKTGVQVMEHQQLPRSTSDHNRLIEIAVDDSEVALEELYDSDDWSRQMSRFDTHLPAELRRARTLVADMTVLKYGIDVLLGYFEMLTDVERSYLCVLRHSIELALEGQSRREIRKFSRYQDRVWDACWSIYFDLTEHMGEEVENFLGQLFHGRTSGCSCDEVAPLKRQPKKSKRTIKENAVGTRETVGEESATTHDKGRPDDPITNHGIVVSPAPGWDWDEPWYGRSGW